MYRVHRSKQPNKSFPIQRAGFTFIEVMIALLIAVMTTSAITAILQTILKQTAYVTRAANEVLLQTSTACYLWINKTTPLADDPFSIESIATGITNTLCDYDAYTICPEHEKQAVYMLFSLNMPANFSHMGTEQ